MDFPEILEYTDLSSIVKKLLSKKKGFPKYYNVHNTSSTKMGDFVFYVSRITGVDYDKPCADVVCEQRMDIGKKQRKQEDCIYHWGGISTEEYIIIFIKDKNGDYFIPNINEKIYNPYDEKNWTSFKKLLNEVKGDTRITNNGKYLLLYDRSLYKFLIASYDKKEKKMVPLTIIDYFTESIGANMSLIDFEVDVDNDEISFSYVDSFSNEKFKIYHVKSNKDNKPFPYDVNINSIKIESFLSYIKNPSLSVGAPHLDISKFIKVKGKTYLGIGHAKISNENKMIETYKSVNKKIENKYKDDFYPITRRFYGNNCLFNRIYYMFFYIFNEDENNVYISNFVLPIGKNKYKFNVIFPMGCYMDGEDLFITAGEGDYYAIELKFNIIDVINSCYHDASNCELKDFNIEILDLNN